VFCTTRAQPISNASPTKPTMMTKHSQFLWRLRKHPSLMKMPRKFHTFNINVPNSLKTLPTDFLHLSRRIEIHAKYHTFYDQIRILTTAIFPKEFVTSLSNIIAEPKSSIQGTYKMLFYNTRKEDLEQIDDVAYDFSIPGEFQLNFYAL